eukprot:2852505-Rhodomonas_salina.2
MQLFAPSVSVSVLLPSRLHPAAGPGVNGHPCEPPTAALARPPRSRDAARPLLCVRACACARSPSLLLSGRARRNTQRTWTIRPSTAFNGPPTRTRICARTLTLSSPRCSQAAPLTRSATPPRKYASSKRKCPGSAGTTVIL